MEASAILIVIAGAIIARQWYRYNLKCPSCNTWNGLKRISSKFDHTEITYHTETKKNSIKDRYGREIGTVDQQVSVPRTENFYRVLFECQRCHQKVRRTLSSGQYSTSAIIFFVVCCCVALYVSNQSNSPQPSQPYTPRKTHPKNIDTLNDRIPKTKHSSSVVFVKQDKDNLHKNALPPPPIDSSKLTNIPNKDTIAPQTSIIVKDSVSSTSKTKNRTIITKEAPEYLRISLAVSMLKRGKSVHDVMDSTYLSKHQIKRLQRL